MLMMILCNFPHQSNFIFQFLHNVILVRRQNNIWKVKHEHVKTGEVFEEEYDFVVVGNGHFSKPNMPTTPGQDIFKGETLTAPSILKLNWLILPCYLIISLECLILPALRQSPYC